MNDWLTGLPDFAPCVVFNKEHNFRNLIYSSSGGKGREELLRWVGQQGCF